jgi:tRNA modification GTPase
VAELPLNRIVLGRWGGPEGEELVVCRRAHYQVEIHPHGGPAAVDEVVQRLKRLGAAEHAWTAWVACAEECPLRAAARASLAEAPTQRTAAILLDQYHGALRRDVDGAIDLLRKGKLLRAADILTKLVGHSDLGRHLTQPWRVVLAGSPNVGKSSLVNALVGYVRALVHDQPGTTRDVVTVRTAIDGWPVELRDTAGLRASSDPLEAQGVRLAVRTLVQADVTVLVLDGTWPIEELRRQLEHLRRPDQRTLSVVNKSDLLDETRRSRMVRCLNVPVLFTSATSRAGVQDLLQVLSALLVPRPPESGEGVPFAANQCESVRLARTALEAGNGPAAIHHLACMFRTGC